MIGTQVGSYGTGLGKGAGKTGEVGMGGRTLTLEEAAGLEPPALEEAAALDDATTEAEAEAEAEAETVTEPALTDEGTALEEATGVEEATTEAEALGVGAAHRGAASMIFPTAQVEASSL